LIKKPNGIKKAYQCNHSSSANPGQSTGVC
jgi:hypothetical protein